MTRGWWQSRPAGMKKVPWGQREFRGRGRVVPSRDPWNRMIDGEPESSCNVRLRGSRNLMIDGTSFLVMFAITNIKISPSPLEADQPCREPARGLALLLADVVRCNIFEYVLKLGSSLEHAVRWNACCSAVHFGRLVVTSRRSSTHTCLAGIRTDFWCRVGALCDLILDFNFFMHIYLILRLII